jgi:hypothetical protein
MPQRVEPSSVTASASAANTVRSAKLPLRQRADRLRGEFAAEGQCCSGVTLVFGGGDPVA